MPNSPGVFDTEGIGNVVIGRNPATKEPIVMYSPIKVAEKFEEAARDNRQGKLAMQSHAQVEKMAAQLNMLTERLAFAEEQLAKSAEKAAIRQGFEKK